ncbi:hypothetical protein BKA24_001772 [Microbacterium marinum]|uniref:Uncharacterized protein n=1 Tax=Microbacterium marinum TaxID=421115 RepID=A0A7W7BQP5_9MICO|nr:hypothetical protein [Microbacterium marinum]MBB4667063.1 hypothetical protein [Microbacterium marinum]
MNTPEQIAQDAMDKHIGRGLPLYGPHVQMSTEAIFTMLTNAIEADRAQRTEYATAKHWEVSHASDEAGEWTYLQIHRDDPEDAGLPPIANLSLSDVEAADLADELSAQRRGRLESLHAYDWKPESDDDQLGEIDADIVEVITIVQIDTPNPIGRMRVYINDGRIYDGDPETGQEWSLT